MLRRILPNDPHFQTWCLSGGTTKLHNASAALTSPLRGTSAASSPPPQFQSQRSFHASCSLGRFWESNPKGEYRNKKFHADLERMQKENWWGIKDGLKDLRGEVGKWASEWKQRLGDDSHLYVVPGDKEKVWTFNNKKVLENWSTLCDSEHNEGFSRCELSISATGKGLFHGFINSTPPKDGRVKNAGYCVMKSARPMKSFQRKSYLDWSSYTHLIMRVRGDGRSYMINISTAGYYDITWNDVYHYVLYTRGGPYWQYVKIPFGKFVFGSKGRMQDLQDSIPLERVASFQLGAGKVDGPFCLEIDYIGLENDPDKKEEFAYEMYRIPKFIANV